ncbi:DUF1702 family protein [Micromonospora sp. NPDC050980]|uniref:DUF1702 family protein n=1 Tax=Micromonospora sp. NPDC050980 TaxID=3155161 RepID=UPI0033EFB797
MSTWRKLRRRVLTPAVTETTLETRGFHVKSPQARDRLEAVGRSFLTGYAIAAEARRPADAEPVLDQLDATRRGFAYEGAAMALAVMDALSPTGGDRVARFLRGEADRHVYMAYVGVGWAMARVPAFRWSTLHAPDPLLRWLVLDGYGFHQAYFHTSRYVYERYREATFRWPTDDRHGYAVRAIDQGIGRAMWFVAGTDAQVLTRMLSRFPQERLPDLYAGAGLAAAYAGGADRAELERFRRDAGPYRAELAQGAAFAAGARVRAGLVVPGHQTATEVLCGMTPAEAARVTDEALVDLPVDGDGEVPAYELWRRRIREALVSLDPR